MENLISEESIQVQELSKLCSTQIHLPEVQIPDKSSRPLSLRNLKNSDLDFQALIEMRHQHQIKQASSGVWTQQATKTSSLCSKLIQEFYSALKTAQDETPIRTGLEREARWRAPTAGGRGGIIDSAKTPELASGNSNNTALIAAAITKQVCTYVKLS